MISSPFFRIRLYGIRHCVPSQNQPHDVVEASGWPKMKVGIGKGADAMTVNQGLDHARRAENRGDSGRVST